MRRNTECGGHAAKIGWNTQKGLRLLLALTFNLILYGNATLGAGGQYGSIKLMGTLLHFNRGSENGGKSSTDALLRVVFCEYEGRP